MRYIFGDNIVFDITAEITNKGIGEKRCRKKPLIMFFLKEILSLIIF
jgi:hypothetical protein